MQVSFQTSPNIVGVNSTLSIMLLLDDQVGLVTGGGIRIQTPSIFSQQIQCTVINPSSIQLVQDPSSGAKCKLLSPSQVQMILASGPIAPGTSLFLQIGTFTNPASTAFNQGFSVSTFDSTGITTSVLSNLSLMQLQPGALQASVSPQTDGIGLSFPQTALLVSMTTSLDLPCTSATQSCSIIVNLPQLQPIAAASQNLVLNSTQLKCELSKSQLSYITIPCTVVQDITSTSMWSLQATSLNSSLIPRGTSMTLKVWGFNNPLDLQPISGFVVKTLDGNGGQIEASSNLSLKVSQPAIITDISATLEGGSQQILGISNIRLDFSVPVPLSSGCIIHVIIPNNFRNLQLSLQAVEIYGMFGLNLNLPFQINSNNDIQISQACPIYSQNSMRGTIKLFGIQNPSVVADTQSFKLVIQDQNNGVIATTQNSFIIQKTAFTPGPFINGTMSISNPTVQETSSLVFTLQSTNQLSQYAKLMITMPNGFSLSTTSTIIPISAQSINGQSIGCQVNNTNNIIQIQNIFYSFGYNPKVDGSLIFNVTSIIAKNPVATIQNAPIQIQTWEMISPTSTTAAANYGLVDQTNIPIEGLLQPGTLKNVTFTTDSNVSNSFPVNGTVSFTLSHSVTAGMQAIITLPADFGIANTALTCTNLSGFNSTSPSCQVINSNNGTSLIVVQGLKSLPLGSNVSLKLSSIRMPRYQGQVSGQITVQTGQSGGSSLVDTSAINFFTQNSMVFTNLQVQLGSNVNSALTSITLNISLPPTLSLVQSDLLLITFPKSGFSLQPGSVSCTINSVQVQCNYNANLKVLTIANLTNSQQIVLQVQGLRNAASLRPQTGFSVQITDSQSRLLITVSPSMVNQLTLQTSIAAPISGLNLLQNSTIPQATSDYSFSFSSQSLPSLLYLALDFQACMAFQTLTASSLNQTYLQLQTTIISPQRLMVQIPVDNSKNSTGLLVRGLLNPSETCLSSGGIQISIFEDSTLLYVMSSGTVQPSLSCTGLCTACLQSQKDFCTSCQSGYVLSADTGVCSSFCPFGSIFNSSLKQCQKCNTSCQNCVDSTDFCTICSDSSMLLNSDGQCISSSLCQLNTTNFVDTQTKECKQCQYPCVSCTEKQCTVCDSQHFLYHGTCVLQCPAGTLSSLKSEGNSCSGEPTKLILLKITSDAPLAYLLVLAFFTASLVKVSCIKEMSLLVTLVVITNLLETTSLYLLIEKTIQPVNYQKKDFNAVQKGLFAYLPLGVILAFLLINVYVVIHHWHTVKTPTIQKQNQEEVPYENDIYEKWSKRNTTKRVAIYFMSVFFSFHNINWFNHDGTFPDLLKQRLLIHRFIPSYAKVTKITMGFPRLLMIAYDIYFGVFNAQGKIKLINDSEAKLVACMVENCLLNLLSIFIMQLALNYQWYDNPIEIIKQHELQKQTFEAQPDEESSEQQQPKMYLAKSSIELHMLKSNRSRKSQFIESVKPKSKNVFNITQQPINASHDTSVVIDDSKNYLQNLEKRISRIEQTASQENKSKSELILVPAQDELNQSIIPQPVSKLGEIIQETENSVDNFDFLEHIQSKIEQMKSKISEGKRTKRKIQKGNASEGKQILRQSKDSDRTIKTQRLGPRNFSLAETNPRNLSKRKLSLIDEVQLTNRSIESVEHNASQLQIMVQGAKKPSGALSKSIISTTTKLDSTVQVMGQEIDEMKAEESGFQMMSSPNKTSLSISILSSPLSVQIGESKQMSKTQIKSKFAKP